MSSKLKINGKPRHPGDGTGETAPQRLDKWLWHARLAKTRSFSARLIQDGKIRVNREKIAKPSCCIRAGDVITAAIAGRIWVIKVLSLPGARVPAKNCAAVYADLTAKAEESGA